MTPAPAYTFAYGMNMYPETMPDDAEGEAAFLHGYQLAWRGYADVEPTGDGTGVVPGVLWKLPPGGLVRLDMREGYPHLYGRQLLNVATRDGRVCAAWVYRMTAETVAQYEERRCVGLASCGDHYLYYVQRGRQEFGHPFDDVVLV